jgi:hypothetical protein
VAALKEELSAVADAEVELMNEPMACWMHHQLVLCIAKVKRCPTGGPGDLVFALDRAACLFFIMIPESRGYLDQQARTF